MLWKNANFVTHFDQEVSHMITLNKVSEAKTIITTLRDARKIKKMKFSLIRKDTPATHDREKRKVNPF